MTRPTVRDYTPERFREWVQRRAFYVGAHRDEAVYISRAYAGLMFRRPLCSDVELGRLLAKADVVREKKFVRARRTLAGRAVMLCGQLCTRLDEIVRHRECCARQRPAFEWLVRSFVDNQLESFESAASVLWARGCGLSHPRSRCVPSLCFQSGEVPALPQRVPRTEMFVMALAEARAGLRRVPWRPWMRLGAAGRLGRLSLPVHLLMQLVVTFHVRHRFALVDAPTLDQFQLAFQELSRTIGRRAGALGWDSELVSSIMLNPTIQAALAPFFQSLYDEWARRRALDPPGLLGADSSGSESGSDSEDELALQGGVVSALLQVEHVHSIEPDQFAQLESLRALVTEAATALPARVARVVAQVLLLVVQVARAQGALDALLPLASFCMSVDWLWSVVGAKIDAMVSASRSFVRLQGWSEAWAALTGAPRRLLEVLGECLITPFLWEAFGPAWGAVRHAVPEFLYAVRGETLKQAAKSAGAVILSVVQEGLRRLSDAVKRRSLRPLFGPSWDPVRWLHHVTGMITYYPVLTCRQGAETGDTSKIEALRREGLIPMYVTARLSLTRYRQILERMRLDGEALRQSSLTFAEAKDVETGLRELRKQLDTVANTEFASADRPAPFCVLLWGDAGTGKTYISRLIGESVGNLCGYEPGPTGRYHWQTAVNFQDGLSHLPWHVLFDDPDTSVAKDTAGVPNHVENLLKLVNNKPLPVEQAAVELKGKINAAPSLVTYCTNFRDCRVRGHTAFPGAFWRRLHVYAQVTVKPEFRRDDTTHEIDPDKVLAAGTRDVYNIHVFQRTPDRGDPFEPPFVHECTLGLAEFLALVVARYKKHISTQILAVDASDSEDFCRVCGQFLRAQCGCPQPPASPRRGVDLELVLADGYPNSAVVLASADPEADERAARARDEWYRQTESGEVYVGPRVVGGLLLGVAGPPGLMRRVFARVRERSLLARDVVVAGVPRAGGVLDDVCKALFGRRFWSHSPDDLFVAMGLAATAGTALYLMLRARDVLELQAREGNAVPDPIVNNWKVSEKDFHLGDPGMNLAPSYTKDQLLAAVFANLATVRCAAPAGIKLSPGKEGIMSALIVTPGVVMVVTHILPAVGGEMRFEWGDREFRFRRSETNTVVLSTNSELSLVSVPALSGKNGTLPYFQLVVDTQSRYFDELEVHSRDRVLAAGVERAELKTLETGRIVEARLVTTPGDCGSVYVARVGKAWRIVAMHYGGFGAGPTGATERAVGGVVTATDLKRAAARLGLTLQMLVTPVSQWTRDGTVPSFQVLPANSEVRDAFGNHGAFVTPIGEMWPRIPGATPKTHVRRTAHSALFEHLERAACGAAGYWGPPRFKGAMVEGKWDSPYQDALTAACDAVPDGPTLWYAFRDYLTGVRELDCTGYRHLSESEAIIGVPGAWVNPINHKTSVGPPFLQKKFLHYARIGDDSWQSPEMAKLRDDIREALIAGYAPAPVGRCVLKDEPVKPGKKARVFTSLPIAYNLELKAAVVPILVFMRANYEWSESFVGIDMSSVDSMKLVTQLKSVNGGSRIVERDARKMDKSWIYDGFLMWCRFCYAIARALGLDAQRVWQLEFGAAHVRFEMRGDVFEAPWNPSGRLGTIELNGFWTSLCFRYEFFRERMTPEMRAEAVRYASGFFDDPLPAGSVSEFRACHALCTFGDDSLCAVTDDFVPRDALWREELGLVITDGGSKAGPTQIKTFEEVTFLKRTPKWSAKAGRYLMALDPKSIVRMCVVRGDAEISDVDHAAVTLSGALREAVAHGEAFYNEYHAAAWSAALQFGFDKNPLFKAPCYREMEDLLLRSDFSAFVETPGFSTAPVVSFQAGESDERVGQQFSTKMEHENIEASGATGTAAAFDAASSSQMDCCEDHPLGEVEAFGGDSALARPAPSRIYQQFPRADLASYLERLTLIHSAALAYAAGQGIEFTIDPFTLFLANDVIAKKTATYNLFRADIEVEVVSVFPSGSYGLYQLCAMPTVPGTVTSTALYPLNCRQLDLSLEIDARKSSTYRLRIPFTYWYDYARLTDYSWWSLSLVRLAGVQTTIPGGVASGYVRVFARFVPGWDMVVPRLQAGEVSVVAGKVSKAAALFRSVPIVGGVADAVANASAVVRDVAAYFGYTREAEEVRPTPMMMKGLANTVRADGRDNGDVLALVGEGQILADARLCDAEDNEGNFSALVQKPTLMYVSTFNSTTLPGDNLVFFPVLPSVYSAEGGAGTYSFTTAGYVGFPFALWRGDIRYHIRVVSGTVHGGSMQVLWSPTVPAPGVEPTNQLRNMIIDLSSPQEHIFTVGFARHELYLANDTWKPGQDVSEVASNGYFWIRLLTPLQTQNDANVVSVLVWQSAGENLDFRMPRYTVKDPTGVAVPFAGNVRLQVGEALGDERPLEPCHVDLVPSSGPYPCDEIFAPGVTVRSVRAAMQKPSMWLNEAGEGVDLGLVTQDPWRMYKAVGASYFGWHEYYASMYLGYAASKRYQVASRTPMMGVAHIGNAGPDLAWSAMQSFQAPGGTQTLSVTIPYSQPTKFFPSAPNTWTGGGGLGLIALQSVLAGEEQVSAMTVACGNDIRLSRFRQVPRVRTANYGVQEGVWSNPT